MSTTSADMNIHIRAPDRHDVPWLAEQMRAFDNFFNGQHSLLPSEPGGLEARLLGFIDNPDTYPWWIAERRSRGPVGFIGGIMHPHFFNPSLRVLTEMFWWVEPNERNTRAGYRLLQIFTLFGRANADMTVMTLEAESPVHFRTLEHFGYRVKETNFMLEV